MQLIDLRITGAPGRHPLRGQAHLAVRLPRPTGCRTPTSGRPTSISEVQRLLAERVRARVADFDAIAAGDLAAFNRMLRDRNIPNIVGGAR
ncbi:MAG: hypothetical protein M0C28_23265 [Candidatus Moduliflexus flocculans]|nr:hypothetical protein [Candidatus Moduliflexus flocculans]